MTQSHAAVSLMQNMQISLQNGYCSNYIAGAQPEDLEGTYWVSCFAYTWSTSRSPKSLCDQHYENDRKHFKEWMANQKAIERKLELNEFI